MTRCGMARVFFVSEINTNPIPCAFDAHRIKRLSLTLCIWHTVIHFRALSWLAHPYFMAAPISPSQKVTPPARRPRRSPRPKLSIPSASLAAAESSTPTRAGEAVDEGASGTPAKTCQMSLQLEGGVKVASLGSEGVGGSVGAAGTAAVAQRNERGTNPADAAGPGTLPTNSRSRPGTASRGIDHQDGDPNNAEIHECPPAAAVVAGAAGEDCGGRSSQSTEDAPGQDTVPAGLLWSDFGGGREAGEDAEETASREFAEESFGMFHGVRLESDSVARSQVRSCRRWLFCLAVHAPPSRLH